MIHPYAIVDPTAQIADHVEIGPWSFIGPHVIIGAHTKIGPHAVIHKWTRIGQHNRIGAFCSLGDDPQDKRYKQEETWLEIGDHNLIREYVSIHRGTAHVQSTTRMGHRNFIMANVHIAHDCCIGNDTVFVNRATLGGCVRVDDFAYLGFCTGIHQFCHIGTHSFISAVSALNKDVPPYMMVCGTPARVLGINRVGLERNHFSHQAIQIVDQAYRIVYRQALRVAQAIEQLQPLIASCPAVEPMCHFLKTSERGIVR